MHRSHRRHRGRNVRDRSRGVICRGRRIAREVRVARGVTGGTEVVSVSGRGTHRVEHHGSAERRQETVEISHGCASSFRSGFAPGAREIRARRESRCGPDPSDTASRAPVSVQVVHGFRDFRKHPREDNPGPHQVVHPGQTCAMASLCTHLMGERSPSPWADERSARGGHCVHRT